MTRLTEPSKYNFPTIIYDNITYKHWQYAKSNTPLLTSMFSLTMRCNANATFAPETLTVQAGKTLGFQLHAGVDGYLNHPGPLLAYMAKVPIGKTAQNWDAKGKQELHFPIPHSTPSGQYLFRIEHIGLHETWQGRRGAQFFVSCAQIEVIGGGEGRPGPLVAFPGAYGFDDPIFGEPLLQMLGVLIWGKGANYLTPGPAVWSG
ncbi:glycosyl hydrolase family 61-domain-containing protein [Halenospora varia]|nr:glycosyl hydrolase family 61-domain-containing protein [Halenospora varia]